MTMLGMIRHGRTAWNEEGRLTGRADIQLTDQGLAELKGLRPPKILDEADWHVSPLQRAQQTAQILGGCHNNFRTDERLIEMDFGDYEGRTIIELRNNPTENMVANEKLGLDFLPPNGESPRMVQLRLRPFLEELGRGGGRHIAVAHKSVIRAVFAEAYDWDMMGHPPIKLHWEKVHLFVIDKLGRLSPVRMNIPMRVVDEPRL